VLTCRHYRDGELVEEGFDPDRISDLLPEEGSLVWLDLEDPDPSELALIKQEFELHPLAIEDAERQGQRPKVEPYDGYFFVVLHTLRLEADDLVEREVHAFVGPKFLVSLRFGEGVDLGPVVERLRRHPDLVREGGGAIFYSLLDEIVDDYLRLIDVLEERTDDAQEQVFADRVPEDIQEHIFRLRKHIVGVRRAASPAREVVAMLLTEPDIVTRRLEAYYRDVSDHVIRALEFVDSVRELLTTALEAHLSQVSNRLNLVMKQLTSWAAIILVPTLIAGIYGMNFRHMPELVWRYGYAWSLGLMAVSATTLYLVFKRRGWL